MDNPLTISILVGFTTILLIMIIKGHNSYNKHIIKALDKIANINKWRKDFLIEVFTLFLSIKGRVNFLQLARYGKFKEQRYRQQFEKEFDFLSFNKELTLSNGSGHYAIAFDPSFINKSGKKTPGLNWYWSGCAGQSKWGLEIGGIAAIDIENHTAFHLEAVQTLKDDEQTLTDWYGDVIVQRKETLCSISKYFVADAWFSKKPFADKISSIGMNLISRLRDDADLRYLNREQPTGKRGRPRKYAGKIDSKNIDKNYFEFISENENEIVYAAEVYSKALKRNIKLVHVTYTNAKQKETYKLYFSTDLMMGPDAVLKYYHSRFQIEFLYRDGKQHTGLNDSQARSKNKLSFQFNASLTSINIARIVHWLSIPKKDRKAFSMTDIKTMNHNALLLQRFFDVFAINPYSIKNQNYVKELIFYGTIAA